MPQNLVKTEIFLEKRNAYHAQVREAQITVDWDEYTKSKDNPDQTHHVVHIETTRTCMKSALEIDNERVHPILWGDSEVMKLYGQGKVYDLAYTTSRLKTWETRWKAKDPFAGFIVEDKEHEEKLLGVVVLGYSDLSPHIAELASMYGVKHQNQKIGSESTGAVIFDWTNYILDHNLTSKDGHQLYSIAATAHIDNAASNHLLKKAGFEFQRAEEKHGAMRNHYIMEVATPVKVAGDIDIVD